MARGNAKPLHRRLSQRRALLVALPLVALMVAAPAALREGLVPALLNPLPAVDLARGSDAWLLDWRLASLRYDPAACARLLRSPQIHAEQIPDGPAKNGCGWTNGVRLTTAGGARASYGTITCEMAAALALWIEHEVQPAAQEHLGQRVASVQSYGSYACRNIVGNAHWRHVRSQHAFANAADIRGFVLADGRTVSVRGQWHADSPEGRFLHAAHARACHIFRAALGPGYNEAHRDHFHLDRGPYSSCR